MKTKILLNAGFAVILSVLMAACGSSDQDSANKPSTPSSSLSASLAVAPMSEVVVRNAETAQYCRSARANTLCPMSKANAVQYCADHGGRLPTIREWTVYAISRSDSGEMLNSAHPQSLCDSPEVVTESDQRREQGYSWFYFNSNGQCKIDFYFKMENYHGHDAIEGLHSLWAQEDLYVFDPISGVPAIVPNDIARGVRCVISN